ncbi:sulfate ABC transporter permease subunit CysT [Roseomonas nepalensis]|uniref:Sulfate transport system permease protein CysT n=1 Tax=Muricoccus nepalensis TaxID=1854500 RepID=A0A502F5W1_9PROT|nr:sulfate ABC transporter permease subunit CysT [Roseomonas nepalensis]TPG44754.1 sulfate ABC transporter permease subunit CysT [Roseomonas nepalensis]
MSASTRPAGRAAPVRAIPGFPATLAITLLWLGTIVLIPLAALALRPLELGPAGLLASLADERVLAALRLSFGGALLAALLNLPLGLLLAWAVVRLRFPGRGVLDAALDLPFALPTAVAGIALTAVTAPNGWIGAPLEAIFGWKIAFTRAGVVLALMFVGLPFIVRTVEPVLRDMAAEAEEAAATLGATRAQTVMRVVLPGLLPALLTGFALAFARAVGEYGSVIFIAGNLPMLTEIAPLLIVIRLEQFDYAGAAAVGLAMLILSFVVLLAIELLQRRLRRGRR